MTKEWKNVRGRGRVSEERNGGYLTYTNVINTLMLPEDFPSHYIIISHYLKSVLKHYLKSSLSSLSLITSSFTASHIHLSSFDITIPYHHHHHHIISPSYPTSVFTLLTIFQSPPPPPPSPTATRAFIISHSLHIRQSLLTSDYSSTSSRAGYHC